MITKRQFTTGLPLVPTSFFTLKKDSEEVKLEANIKSMPISMDNTKGSNTFTAKMA